GYPCTEEQVAQRLAAFGSIESQLLCVAELSVGAQEPVLAGLLAVEFGRFFHNDARHAHLTALVVDRRCRHRGVARALLAAAFAEARRRGCELVHVRSNRRRDDAHAFYRAAGFDETHLTFNKKL